MEIVFNSKNKRTILALGAESAGNFSVFHSLPFTKGRARKGSIFFSEDFGDLLEEMNWKSFRKAVSKYLKDKKIRPDVIISDLHPLFNTTQLGKNLAQKFKAEFLQVQHHHAHIFSAIGDKIIATRTYNLEPRTYAIACDGTGYGLDGKVWGGEVFKISNFKFQISNKNQIPNSKFQVTRIGRLENQILIGGDLAIREPARMLISILYKISSSSPVIGRGCPLIRTGEGKEAKKFVYSFVKEYYSPKEFELIYNQLLQKFNCQETTSAGRILDAVSLLLGFCGNERRYKHEPIDMLEKNSTQPYSDLKPKILRPLGSTTADPKGLQEGLQDSILDTKYLFNYVINYLHKKDKKRLAATAQLYLAKGLWEIIEKDLQPTTDKRQQNSVKLESSSYNLKPITHNQEPIFFAGGLANNKIMSSYLESKGAYASKKIPRGDAGISFGQVVYYLLSQPRI